jgi:hypothetical protein
MEVIFRPISMNEGIMKVLFFKAIMGKSYTTILSTQKGNFIGGVTLLSIT